MPNVNATVTPAKNTVQLAPETPVNRLFNTRSRNSAFATQLQVMPASTFVLDNADDHPVHRPHPGELHPALCTGMFGSSHEGKIFDQPSLNKAWSSIVHRLLSHPITERDLLLTLKSGILQTPTGMAIAPLLEEAVMRSIKPLGGLTLQRLGEYVRCICELPPERWLPTFGENTSLPQGGVHGYIQSELTIARAKQEQKIIAGEILDNKTWKALRDFSQQARVFIHPQKEVPLNEILALLEEYSDIRPAQKEAKNLLERFLRAMCKPDNNELAPWENGFATAQKLSDRINAIQRVDVPETSWQELIVNAESKRAASTASASRYFVFDSAPKSARALSEKTLSFSQLLSLAQEVDAKSSFYSQVIIDGPQFRGGVLEKLTYATNLLGTAAELFSPLRIDKPTPFPITAVGFPLEYADTCMNPEHFLYSSGPSGINANERVSPTDSEAGTAADDGLSASPAAARFSATEAANAHITHDTILAQVRQTEGEIIALLSSVMTRNVDGSQDKVSPDPAAPTFAALSPATSGGATLEHLVQSVLDVLSRIDTALKFPEAGATELGEALHPAEEFLLSDRAYGSTVEAIPSWWEALVPDLQAVLSRLSAVLVPGAGYALNGAGAGLQLVGDNPRASATAAFVALSALYNQFRQSAPALAATNAPPSPLTNSSFIPDLETPALHEERLEDDIEEILEKPDAAGAPALSETILRLMYASTEQDLLDDDVLIEQVAQVLQKHSPQTPAKSYFELIQEVQQHASFGSASDVHNIRKRGIETDSENPLSFNAVEEDVEPTPDLEESEPAPEEILTQYLEILEALESRDLDADPSLNDGRSESAADTARQVISLLRHRRSATWSDASRANGDSQLVGRYVESLNRYADSQESYSSLNVTIPMHSSFGRCWLNAISAFKNPFFIEWAGQLNLDLASVRVSTADNTLTGTVKGVRTTFTLNDDTGWSNVAGPLLRMVRVIDPTYIGINYPTSSSIPLALVSGFYGESTTPDRTQAKKRAAELSANNAFAQIKPDDLLRPAEQRSEAQVDKQRQLLGDLYSYHSLKSVLAELINDTPDNAPVNLATCKLPAHKDSLFALRHPQEAHSFVSAQRFISAMGWTVPKNAGEVRNLIRVLTFALPESTERGNFQGALAYPRPLTPAQIQTVRQTVLRFEQPFAGGLLNNLLQSQTVTSPAQGLHAALNSEKAKQLGATLESNLNAIASPGSATEWVMAALLLDLEATPGLPRNHVAGYNLTQAANWGAKPSVVVTRLQSHLVAGGKVSSTTAPVAAYQLLAGVAPEFLVRDIPDNLVCGSHTWTSFRIAVARIEQLNPGAARQMSFEQVMDYGSTGPITAGQEIATQSASVDPLIDWAIANGIIVPNASDTYTPAQLTIASEKFDQLRAELARAREFLTAPLPTREDLALAELERVFGKGLPYKDKCFRKQSIPLDAPISMYSLLDLYMTGRTNSGVWSSYNRQMPIHQLEKKFNQLKPIESFFKESFTSYFDNLRSGSSSIFKYLITQLPLEDRQSLEYGKQEFYSVRDSTHQNLNFETPEMIEAQKGRYGILIRSTYQNKVTYYEVFPNSVEIRKNIKLPDTLQLGGATKEFVNPRDPIRNINSRIGTPQPIDWEAYKKGTTPKNDVSSNVIIEEIKPITKQVVFWPSDFDFSRVPYAFSPASRAEHLASVVVDQHFVVGREQLEQYARGSTDTENEQRLRNAIEEFFLGLVPFKSCIENIIQGNVLDAALDCTLDAAGFVIPGGMAIGKAAKVAKSAVRFIPKVTKITWIVSSSLVSNANPFDGVGSLLRSAKNVVCTLGTLAYRAGDMGIGQIKKIYGCSKAIDKADLLKHANTAEGVTTTGIPGQTGPVTALFKDGQWYAYDVSENRPYGPPLESFVPDSSIPLERTTFSDGTSAYTPNQLFDSEAHIIQRSSHVDVVVGDTVYRYDPESSNSLIDITSPIYFKELEGFEAVCPIGGRSKRSYEACFSKIVKGGGTRAQKRAQAIQHKRLYPSRVAAGEVRKLFNERRLFTVADTGQSQKLVPSPLAEPVQVKSKTTGSIINDGHFGLPNKEVDAGLEAMTRPVRIGGIVHGVDDQRDVRALIVDYDHQNTGMKNYLVVEAETGLYYYCDYDPAIVNGLTFTQINTQYSDSLGSGLIKSHDAIKDQLLSAAGTLINRNFVALPPLDSLYMDLVMNKGYTFEKINALKAKIALLSKEQQREFVLNVWNKGSQRNVEIALPTIKVEPLQKSPGFNSLSSGDQNKAYANGAKEQVDRQFEATGLKSANQVIYGDANDLQRQVLTRPVVIWEYTRLRAPNYADLILRTGAGNCDQMAWAAAKIVNESGGTASLWAMPGAHTFALVGVPRGTAARTVNFSEAVFKDAWIMDPWAGISCKASEYMTLLEFKMISWDMDGKKLLLTDWLAPVPTAEWKSPLDPLWIAQIIHGEKVAQ